MRILAVLLALALPTAAIAHDTWIETNTPLVRTGDVIHINLMLGNHGNHHRDFKIASKTLLDPTQISLTGPTGVSFDLKPELVDAGLSPKDGYWTARFVAKESGLYVVNQTSKSMHGKTRSMKSGKAFFVASPSLDHVPSTFIGFEKPLGETLEIVPLINPVTEVAPGQPIRVKVLYKSQPLKSARLSFVPRGTLLTEGFDNEYERETDAVGVASYTPKEGNVILVVVHHTVPEGKPGEYDATSYSSTLTIAVPEIAYRKGSLAPSN